MLGSSLLDDQQATVAKKPGHRKPENHCAGKAGMFGVPVVNSCALCAIYLAHEAAGAAGIRLSPRPLFEEGQAKIHNSGKSGRGMLNHVLSVVMPRACGASSIPEASRLSQPPLEYWIARSEPGDDGVVGTKR